MPPTPHPDPRQAFFGRTLNRADDAALLARGPGSGEPTPRQTLRPALVDDLPELFTLEAGFSSLSADETANPDLPTWLELMRVSPDDPAIGQELFLNGVTIEQMSADTAGALTGPVTACPWGDKYGRGAAIVVGVNLPCMPIRNNGTTSWIQSAFEYPGMGGTPATDADWNPGIEHDIGIATNPLGIVRRQRFLFTLGWVQGSITDAFPYQRIVPRSFGALGRRIGFGEALQVALVLRQNTFDGSECCINGHCNIQLHFATTVGRGQFNDRA